MLADLDSDAAQFVLVSDAGLHQHLGRVNRAKRQHHLGVGGHAMERAAMDDLDSGGPVAVEDYPGDQRVRHNRQVRLIEIGGGVGAKHR